MLSSSMFVGSFDILNKKFSMIVIFGFALSFLSIFYRIYIVQIMALSWKNKSSEEGLLVLILSYVALELSLQNIDSVSVIISCLLLFFYRCSQAGLWVQLLINHLIILFILSMGNVNVVSLLNVAPLKVSELLVLVGFALNSYILNHRALVAVRATEKYSKNLGYKVGCDLNILGFLISFVVSYYHTSFIMSLLVLGVFFSTLFFEKKGAEFTTSCLDEDAQDAILICIFTATYRVADAFPKYAFYFFIISLSLYVSYLIYFKEKKRLGAILMNIKLFFFLIFLLNLSMFFIQTFTCEGAIRISIAILLIYSALEGFKGPIKPCFELGLLWYNRVFYLGFGKQTFVIFFICLPVFLLVCRTILCHTGTWGYCIILILLIYSLRYPERICTWAVDRLYQKGFSDKDLGPLYLNPGMSSVMEMVKTGPSKFIVAVGLTVFTVDSAMDLHSKNICADAIKSESVKL